MNGHVAPIERKSARLLSHRLIINLGKGGTGKSAVSAAVAVAAARRGMNTLVVQLDAKDRLSEYLGSRVVDEQVREIEPRLHAINIMPQEALRRYVLHYVKFEAIYKIVFENRLVAAFMDGVPAISDLVMLSQVEHLAHKRNRDGSFVYDIVIIDAPPTGHGLFFLTVPSVILRAVSKGPIRASAEQMIALFSNPDACAVNLVALPEELPVSETIDAADSLGRAGIGVASACMNRYTAGRFEDDCIQAARDLADAVPLDHPRRGSITLLQDEMTRFVQAAGHVARLKAMMPDIPMVNLPDLHCERFGRAEIETLALALEELL